jgi:hypothetical protein
VAPTEDCPLPFTEIRTNLWTPAKFQNWKSPLKVDPLKEDPSRVSIVARQCEFCAERSCACVTTRVRTGATPQIVTTDNMGEGAQAVLRYEPGDLLGEFVGELAPLEHYDDGYAADLYRYDLSESERGVAVCTVHPRHYGNWARKINHACEPNASLESMRVSGRWRVMVQALSVIEPGTWITVDYGKRYWSQSKEPCKCGSDRCYRRSKGRKKGESSTSS